MNLFVSTGNPAQGLSLWLQLLRGRKVALTVHGRRALERFLRRAPGRVEALNWKNCDHKGLFYLLNEEAIAAARDYYASGPTRLAKTYAAAFKTDKVDAFFQWHLARAAYSVLCDLHLLRLRGAEAGGGEALLPGDAFTRFVVAGFRRKYGEGFPVLWLAAFDGLPGLFSYYRWLGRQLLRRGARLGRPALRFRYWAEAMMGTHREVLRDDVFVDGENIRAGEALFTFSAADPMRVHAAGELSALGYRCEDDAALPFRLADNWRELFSFYFLQPAAEYFRLLFEGNLHFLPALLFFRKDGLLTQLLIDNFGIEVFVSTSVWGGIPQSAIAAKNGSRTCFIQTSDIANGPDRQVAFLANTRQLYWGDASRDFHPRRYVDQPISVGCFFKSGFRRARAARPRLRASLGLDAGPVVTFFATGFDDTVHYGEAFFLRYLDLVRRFCAENPGVAVLLKPKAARPLDADVSSARAARFSALWKELSAASNFKFLLGWRRDPEAAIAISDVVVTMGMTSPSTIALICGVDALYFDDTGNPHPLAQAYHGSLVFDDGEALLRQAAAFLRGPAHAADLLPESVLAAWDEHRDDGALERVRAVVAAGKAAPELIKERKHGVS